MLQFHVLTSTWTDSFTKHNTDCRYLGFSNLELLVVLVDDRQGRPASPCERHGLGVGGQLDGPLACDSIAGIEHHTVGDGTEHGNVFEAHLGRTIRT